jgi:hypothetical protein
VPPLRNGAAGKPGAETHTERELGQPRDEDRAALPGIEIAVERDEAERTSGEPERARCGEDRPRTEAAKRGPQQRHDRIQLQQQPDVPPRGHERVHRLREKADARRAEHERRPEFRKREQGADEQHRMRAEPERIDARGPRAKERAGGDALDPAPARARGQTETARDQKERDALIADPADVAHGRRGEGGDAAAERRRELRDPRRERRPRAGRIAGEFRTPQALHDVVQHDPQHGDALERVEPHEVFRSRRAGGRLCGNGAGRHAYPFSTEGRRTVEPPEHPRIRHTGMPPPYGPAAPVVDQHCQASLVTENRTYGPTFAR